MTATTREQVGLYARTRDPHVSIDVPEFAYQWREFQRRWDEQAALAAELHYRHYRQRWIGAVS